MKSDELKALQAPFKERYRTDPHSAQAVLKAEGQVNVETLTVNITSRQDCSADLGLHPLTGGDGSCACAAEMLLEALVGCAGVTLSAVCTAMSIPVDRAEVVAEGALDFRGTLGVSRDVPIGFSSVKLRFLFASAGSDEQLAKATQLAERYCVVAQTLRHVESSWERLPI